MLLKGKISMEYLSTFQDTTDQQPNIELAARLAEKRDTETIAEIAENLTSKFQSIAGDCIKVMYEIGKTNPELITGYFDKFIQLLSSKNNRMVWGAMYAVAQTAPYRMKKADENFGAIVDAYQTGSVITIDNSIEVFAQIAKSDVSNSKKAYELIINHLKHCRAKEIPQHCEKAFVCVNETNFPEFKKVLENRFYEMSPSQQARVKKILKKIENKEFCE